MENGITFLDLAAFHFRKLTFTQGPEYEQQILVMNFTDLLRNFMLKGALERSNCTESIKLKYSAIMLRRAGIKFKVSRDNCLINIQFENGVLKIPRFEVHDSFERFVRNLMALGAVLQSRGIILNCLGDSESVSNLINNLCHQTSETYSCYSDICQRMNEHYENRWNHRRATLKLVYFSNVWRGTGIVAAAILLILTLIQTIISVKSLF
uniref:Uncharacterized protein n=1 Tax=Salix viminalis TaxID=40686 RepID=A0A6N2MSP0_SALVM